MDVRSQAAPDGADQGYRALVVDDEKPLADVVASYLEREHFEVTVCLSGVDALSVARQVDPDVVVLDLGLPGIDGLEVCRQLRTFSDAYVVMLTARDTEVDTIVGLSVGGADDYVTKPFSLGSWSPDPGNAAQAALGERSCRTPWVNHTPSRRRGCSVRSPSMCRVARYCSTTRRSR